MNSYITKNDFNISTDKNKIDLDYIHKFLSGSYWSPGISKIVVKKAMENSLCFGVYKDDRQIGYARVITDAATFAYIADVFIDDRFRGNGLGKWLIDTIINHKDLQNLRRIILTTKDAHKLYEKSGFMSITYPERYMVYNPSKV